MYNNVHKSFLQACSNHGTIKKSIALQMLKKCMKTFADDRNCTEEILKEVIEMINEKIAYIDQKIITTYHELLAEEYIVLINTVPDPIHKARSNYTDGDRKYFALLLTEITKIDKHCLNVIAATNIIFELKDKKLTKQYASKLLDNWIETGYFINCNDIIYLGPKGIAEFGEYLKSYYPKDTEECKICNTVIFYGLECGNSGCTDLLHSKCIQERLRKFNNCPSCKGLWQTTNKEPSME